MHNQVVEFLNKSVPGCLATATIATVGHSSVTVAPTHIFDVCKNLKESTEFHFHVLHVISGTDFPATGEIEVAYILSSYSKNLELILKTRLPRGDKNNLPKLNSVVKVWTAANFQERECYDMIGVDFVGHPDLRRILCSDGWDGHPLRKDYVTPEKFQGMVINPPEKVNTQDHFFGKRLREEIGDPKKVSWSWKDDSETEAKEGE
jgi:NADH-quinone oxidoreductase subunit C